MKKHPYESRNFSLETTIQWTLMYTEVKNSLMRSQGKEIWIHFLKTDDPSGFIEEDQQALDRIVGLIRTFATFVMFDRLRDDFHDTFEKINQGQNVELPESVKIAHEKAVLYAKEMLIKQIIVF